MPDQEASYQLTWLTRRLLLLLRIHQPEAIFTHPFEGGHPDHDACAFAVHHAVGLAPFPSRTRSHHRRSARSTTPAGSAREWRLEHFFPPSPQTPRNCLPAFSSRSSSASRLCSIASLRQRDVLRRFSVAEERFRIAPAYEFRRPPNSGSVFYDNYSWGVKSNAFCELAWEAEDALEEEMKAACC